MAAAAHFQPAATSFGVLTLHRPRTARAPRLDVGRHRLLIMGWVFSACFLAGLGSLYMLDRAAFTAAQAQAVLQAPYLVDYD